MVQEGEVRVIKEWERLGFFWCFSNGPPLSSFCLHGFIDKRRENLEGKFVMAGEERKS